MNNKRLTHDKRNDRLVNLEILMPTIQAQYTRCVDHFQNFLKIFASDETFFMNTKKR